MSVRLLLDTSSVIVLARLGVIDDVRTYLGTIYIAPEVHGEATVAGRPGAAAVESAIRTGLITVLQPQPLVSLSGLGTGETATIRRAIDEDMTAVIDDLDARRAAARIGVRLTGTIALLVRLDRSGGSVSIRDAIDRLDDMGFRVAATVRAWALAQGQTTRDP